MRKSSKFRNVYKLLISTVLLTAAITFLNDNKALGAEATEGNIKWEIIDNTLYIKPVDGTDGAMTDYYYMGTDAPWYNKDYDDIVIENGVTSIGSEAFYNSKVKNVTIAETVTSIGNSAFYNNNLLETINIPGNVKTIGESAFNNCDNSSGKLTFNFDCLVTPNVGQNAFSNIGRDGQATINVKSNEVYLQLSNLIGTSSHLELKVIGDNNAITDGNIKLAIIDNALHIMPVDGTDGKMKDYPFGGPWKKLSFDRIVIEDGVTSIGDNAFKYSYAKEITIADTVTAIGENAFSDNNSLVSVNIPDSVKIIENYAFESGGNLGKLTINFECLDMPEMADRVFWNSGSSDYLLNINVMNPYMKQELNENILYIHESHTVADINVISKTNISDTDIEQMDSYEYTGKKIEPLVTIKQKKYLLELNKDYKVSYENNIYAGMATVTITGIGDYTDSIKKTFAILPILDKTDITIYKQSSETVKLTGAADKAIWKSADKAIATVDSKGKITGVKAGTTTITASVNGAMSTCDVTVKELNISKSSISMYTDDKQTLKIIGASGKVTWKSSNKNVASVNAKGLVTGVKAGKATITATYNNKAYTCKVTITKRPTLIIDYVYWKVNMFDGVEPTISFKNTSLKTIKYIYLETSYYNTVGDPAYSDIGDEYEKTLQITGPIKPGEGYLASWDAVIYNSAMGRLDINNISVTFMDGSVTKIKFNKSYYN